MQSESSKPDYKIFNQWFESNGGRAKKIQFPCQFGPIGYLGIGAAQNIKANQVIMAIPKKLIIGVTMVRQSKLGKILDKYFILSDVDNEQTDFHILALYLIWQKQLGKQSFFYPYLQSIQTAETILSWPTADIQKLKQPTITSRFIQYIKKDFPQVFNVFVEISVEHQQLFKQIITWQSFMESYSVVMTRCFGWGLPETMMVPYADFFNHSCSGVHHYIFNRKLQEQQHQTYIKKSDELDLSLLQIDNKKKLPTSYARNLRQNFVHKHRNILKKKQIKYEQEIRLDSNLTKSYLQTIQQQLLSEHYNVPLLPSSDSQDNDSEDDEMYGQGYDLHMFFKNVNKIVKNQLDPVFEQPKPYVNRQFLDGVDFSWWSQQQPQDSYFIITAASQIPKGQQIFNSYGRRSNRFLLVWYGFALFNNKYDSIPFRILSEQIFQKTGKMVYIQYLMTPHITIGDTQYGYQSLSEEYRLKKRSICYNLLAFLRRRVIRKSQIYQDLYKKKLLTLHQIKNLQLQKVVIGQYTKILKYINAEFDPSMQRQSISPSYRDYFAHLILNSNKEILQSHMKSVKILKKLIQNLEKGMTLQDTYNFQYQQDEHSTQIKINNRKHILDYFKMLSKCKKIKITSQ